MDVHPIESCNGVHFAARRSLGRAVLAAVSRPGSNEVRRAHECSTTEPPIVVSLTGLRGKGSSFDERYYARKVSLLVRAGPANLAPEPAITHLRLPGTAKRRRSLPASLKTRLSGLHDGTANGCCVAGPPRPFAERNGSGHFVARHIAHARNSGPFLSLGPGVGVSEAPELRWGGL